MWYAIFPGDYYHHLVKSQSTYTLCGLPTTRRDRSGEEYRPPTALYRSCPRCVAEDNALKSKGDSARRETPGVVLR